MNTQFRNSNAVCDSVKYVDILVWNSSMADVSELFVL